MSRRFRLVLSGACALLAALLCILYGQSVREESEAARAEVLERFGGEVVPIVVAAQGLEAGDVVDSANAFEADWASDLVPSGAYTSLEDVYGLEITEPVAQGVPLTELNFRDNDSQIDVPSGKVALTLQVSEKLGLPTSAGPGTQLAAYEVGDEGVELLSASLEVLRYAGSESAVGSRGNVTVALDSSEVPSVLMASAEGSLRLALPADDADVSADDSAEAPTEVPAGDADASASEAVEEVDGQ